MPNVPLLDYCFLLFESRESPKHVAGLQVFDLPEGAPDDFVRRLVDEARASPPVAPFSQKLHVPTIGMPQWVEDDAFEPAEHIVCEAVPEPHDMAALLERCAWLHADQLDRDSPLWELVFFEHLEANRFAVYFKVHHAYMDGVSLSRRAMASLDTRKRGRGPVAFWGEEPMQQDNGRHGLLANALAAVTGAAKAAVVTARLGQLAFQHGLRLLHAGAQALPIPFTAPRTAFNTPLTPERSVAVTELELDRVRKIAGAAHVTVNDVLLCVCDRALQGYLDEHGGHPDKPLVAQMPISLKRETTQQGNQITIALLELGSETADPVKRLREINRHSSDVKRAYTGMSPESAEIYTLLMQSVAQIGETLGLDGTMPPLGNVVISNLVGPKRRRYLRGALLSGIYPISTIAPGLALNITIYSYAGTLYFGLVAGHHAIPNLASLADGIPAALAELEAALQASDDTMARRRSGSRAGARRGVTGKAAEAGTGEKTPARQRGKKAGVRPAKTRKRAAAKKKTRGKPASTTKKATAKKKPAASKKPAAKKRSPTKKKAKRRPAKKAAAGTRPAVGDAAVNEPAGESTGGERTPSGATSSDPTNSKTTEE